MKNILKVAVFVLVIAMVAVPSFAADNSSVGYNATVVSGQDTSVTTYSGAFGQILVGDNKTILDSVNLSNIGDFGATVDAKFTSYYLTTFGLNATTSGIGAGNFSLKDNTSSTWIPLNNDGSDKLGITTVPASLSRSLDARLFVPTGTPAGAYNGTILLTFGEVP